MWKLFSVSPKSAASDFDVGGASEYEEEIQEAPPQAVAASRGVPAAQASDASAFIVKNLGVGMDGRGSYDNQLGFAAGQPRTKDMRDPDGIANLRHLKQSEVEAINKLVSPLPEDLRGFLVSRLGREMEELKRVYFEHHDFVSKLDPYTSPGAALAESRLVDQLCSNPDRATEILTQIAAIKAAASNPSVRVAVNQAIRKDWDRMVAPAQALADKALEVMREFTARAKEIDTFASHLVGQAITPSLRRLNVELYHELVELCGYYEPGGGQVAPGIVNGHPADRAASFALRVLGWDRKN